VDAPLDRFLSLIVKSGDSDAEYVKSVHDWSQKSERVFFNAEAKL
jgi:hypothetical protein